MRKENVQVLLEKIAVDLNGKHKVKPLKKEVMVMMMTGGGGKIEIGKGLYKKQKLLYKLVLAIFFTNTKGTFVESTKTFKKIKVYGINQEMLDLFEEKYKSLFGKYWEYELFFLSELK